MTNKKTNILTKNQWIFVFLVFVTLILSGYYVLYSPNNYHLEQPLIFEIKSGESFQSVTDRLNSLGIVPNKTVFRIVAFVYGAETKVKAARFKIENGLSYLDLLDLLIFGPADYLRSIRINDGQTIKWLSGKVRRDLRMDSTAFYQKAHDKEFIASLGLDVPSLEGYLFSKSYQIYERSDPEEVLKIFYDALKEFWTDTLQQRADSIKLSMHQVLTLASIIKGETNEIDEMPRISGVYHNRLRKGMKLQADPTVQYLMKNGWKRLTYQDLNIDSPYNTYRYFGLPPAPINNPGANAILAALYPEKHDYYFFVADGKGKHKFAKNYSEHLKNVREYRKWLSQ
ncbi:Putative periplasmic solute-binding protein [Ignavibacterium album JCM 16511]|uniref:Endolytic murein transglycosylase n=1 Tax=Ignavibacterium album (strain DSM 19864 / JCM 16511 / NBRC 101810 / Mat9-16) TaxID=945713 RepID=I0AJK1_IGNAJ|nr:endolytic transglycosylase MltG [Ignavibacterium album]AFH49158.1 Putative periplasmic solute-binding protein [Ignavibacterium album JCM 16511]